MESPVRNEPHFANRAEGERYSGDHCCRTKAIQLARLMEQRTVIAGDDHLLLTLTEFDLLSYLGANANTTVTHGELAQAIWSRGHEDEQECLRVLINRPRKTIESFPKDPKYLLTDIWAGHLQHQPPRDLPSVYGMYTRRLCLV